MTVRAALTTQTLTRYPCIRLDLDPHTRVNQPTDQTGRGRPDVGQNFAEYRRNTPPVARIRQIVAHPNQVRQLPAYLRQCVRNINETLTGLNSHILVYRHSRIVEAGAAGNEHLCVIGVLNNHRPRIARLGLETRARSDPFALHAPPSPTSSRPMRNRRISLVPAPIS